MAGMNTEFTPDHGDQFSGDEWQGARRAAAVDAENTLRNRFSDPKFGDLLQKLMAVDIDVDSPGVFVSESTLRKMLENNEEGLALLGQLLQTNSIKTNV